MDLTALSQGELREFAAKVISLIGPADGLGTPLFEAIIKIVPQTALEALVVDNIDNPREILAIWREDENYLGWHFPGSFVRFGESFDQTLERVVKRELSGRIAKVKNTGINYNLVDQRGQTIGLVFLVELQERPKEGQWFKSVPGDMLPHHKDFLKKVLGWE